METGGTMAGSTAVPRRRQRQVVLEEVEEERRRERARRNDFRTGFNATMHEIAISAKQEVLMKLLDRLHDYELALAEAEDSGSTARARVYRNSLDSTKIRIVKVEDSIEKMQSHAAAFAALAPAPATGSATSVDSSSSD